MEIISEFYENAIRILKNMEKQELSKAYIFYVDCSPNVQSEHRVKRFGIIKVLLKNTNEIWTNRIDTTVNKGFLLGVGCVINLAIERGYTNIEIRTQCLNVINFIGNKRGDKVNNVKHPNIKEIVEKIREYIDLIPNWSIKKINKNINLAKITRWS